MIRTQIYLTEQQHEGLKDLSKASGKSRSELIREAIDRLLEQTGEGRRQAALDRAAGMWKDRKDLPGFGALRKDWDRDEGAAN